jgi:hypothetical protein
MNGEGKAIQVDYAVRILSPFHVGTGYGLASLVDSRTVRGHDGLAYIPGSTVKGLVREAFRKVAGLFGSGSHTACGSECGKCLECILFGTALRPGLLAFGDARLPEGKVYEIDGIFRDYPLPKHIADSETRTHVRLTRWSRTALSGYLFTFELAGNGLCYEGSILGRLAESTTGNISDPGRGVDKPRGGSLSAQKGLPGLGDQEKGDNGCQVPRLPDFLPLLAAAMSSVENIGRGKSRGWGRCEVRITKIYIDGNDAGLDHGGLLSILKSKSEPEKGDR